jgi:hypothetical protein
MGCIGRLGCLILLAILICVGWFTRDLWVPERFRVHEIGAPAAQWQPATTAGAERAQNALTRLKSPKGPVSQTLSAGDIASLAMNQLTRRLGGAPDSVAARVDGDRLSVRARIDFSALRGSLGAMGAMLGNREMVELTGTFHMLRPGMGEFEVLSARVGRLALPQAMIARLIQQLDHGTRPAGLRPEAIPLPMPSYLSDIRITNGKVTLYKKVN